MGDYTEFHFRAHVKDGPVADWLERAVAGDVEPYGNHPFFYCDRWRNVLRPGGGLNDHISAPTVFSRTGAYQWRNKLLINSVLKNYDGELGQFVAWILPHLSENDGAFLGYSNAEDAPWDELDDRGLMIEQPVLYRVVRAPIDLSEVTARQPASTDR